MLMMSDAMINGSLNYLSEKLVFEKQILFKDVQKKSTCKVLP